MSTPTSYDQIPYHSHPFAQSHPEHLRALAHLFGLESSALACSRVLELGCASGGNIIPLAVCHPEARFIGIDASARQVAQGWQLIDRLGLKNIELRHVDIADITRDLGEFDYIVCHGVFSWVPRPIQDKILDICKQNLSRDGVAYVSYNTYPGWHIRGIVRDIMRFRELRHPAIEERIPLAKEFIDFIANNADKAQSEYASLLQKELNLLNQAGEWYIHHDHFEKDNSPIYFFEFAERVATRGLQYLAESEVGTMLSSLFPANVSAKLNEYSGGDIVQTEQCMDFLRCRYFRQTLVCHRGVQLNRKLSPDRLAGTLLSASIKEPAQPVDYSPKVSTDFVTSEGKSMSSHSPAMKAAFTVLQKSWPLPLSLADLKEQSVSLVAEKGVAYKSSEGLAQELEANLLLLVGAGAIRMTLAPPSFTTQPGAKPIAFRLARLQAETSTEVTNLRHEFIRLDELRRAALSLLDGTRDEQALTEAIAARIRQGAMTIRRGDTVLGVEGLGSDLHKYVRSAIEGFARLSLLEA